MKVCSKCKMAKPLSEYPRHPRYKDGYKSWCRGCISDYNKEYQKGTTPNTKKRKLPNKWRRMFWAAKARAKENGIPFDLKFEEIPRPMCCPVLGIPIDFDKGPAKDSTPSLDRVIPEKGYTKGNVVVMSTLANTMKNKGTLDQCIALGEWAKKMKELTKDD